MEVGHARGGFPSEKHQPPSLSLHLNRISSFSHIPSQPYIQNTHPVLGTILHFRALSLSLLKEEILRAGQIFPN